MSTVSSKSKILVVDDDPQILTDTARLLTHAGYLTIEAQTGQQALAAARKHLPDLILLSNRLPDLKGIEVCRRLKANKATAGIFVSIVSGLSTKASDQFEGLETGADEYIVRPTGDRELLARVQSMLRLNHAEKELEQHRNHLEKLVAEKTEALNREIKKHKQAKETEARLRQRSQEMAMLNMVSIQACQSLSARQVTASALESMLKATAASAAFLLEKKGDELIPIGTAFSDPSRSFAEFPTHKLGECLCGTAALEGRGIYSMDIENDSRCNWEECKKAGMRSAASLPLFSGNDVIAVLGLGTDHPHDFAAQTEFLETLAAAVGLGLQNALLFEQTRQISQDLEKKVRKRTRELENSQQALMTSLEDIQKAKLEIENANLRLKELDRLKSMFIASMSHELRTPLNSIIGFTGILLQGLAGELNEEQKDQLGRVSRAGKHLLALITDVIDVSKIEAGRVELVPEEIELGQLIDEAMLTIAKEAEQKGLGLHIDMVQPIRIHTDRRRLFQCLINLLANAVKYSERGRIVISARTADQKVTIRVTDTGIGIAEPDLKLMFSSFVRLESHLKATTPGTGLGLYLTQKIVIDLLGGKLGVESCLGEGSTFEITLPVFFSLSNDHDQSLIPG